jgi:hypothetical protein
MIIDKLTTLADSLALNTGAAGAYIIGDQIDVAKAFELWDTEEIYVVARMATDATSSTSTATLVLDLVTDDNAALSSPTVVVSSGGARAVPALTRGTTLFAAKLPKGFASERYLGVRQTTGTQAFTAGSVDVFFTPNISTWRAFADNLVPGQI